MQPIHSLSPACIDAGRSWSHGDIVQMNAVVAACALVAHADGWVTRDERRRLVERMRASHAGAFFGADEVIRAFETECRRFERDLDEAETHAEAAVVRLRPNRNLSILLVETACAIARSDGGFDAEERATVVRLCELLDLDPDDIGVCLGPNGRWP